MMQNARPIKVRNPDPKSSPSQNAQGKSISTHPSPSPIPKKFPGYVTLNYPFRLRGFPFFLPPLFFLMPFEVLNILRMNQILDLDIRPAVELLPMMNLIFVLFIAMVSRPKPQIG